MSTLLLFPLLGYLASRAPGVASQGTNAVCDSSYDWMNNSNGQSPCLIASYLFTPCASPAASWVYPLSPGYHYNTPQNNAASATPCRCNTVLFSVLAACATCQGQEEFIIPWNEYAENCSTVFVQKYPAVIPAGTAIPAWAYLDITGNNTFDPGAARAIAAQNVPESTASVKPSSTGSELTAPPAETNDAPQSGGGTSKSSVNVAAIVGGVVGGVVGVIAIGLAVFFFLRYRRNREVHQQPTGPLDLTAGSGGYAQYPLYNEYPQYGEKSPSQEVAQPLMSNHSPRLYDPNDPSTFPTSGGALAESVGGSVHPTTDPSLHSSSHGRPTSGYQNPAYRGAPEL
ncbi:hypothetical protein C8Q76DRAFT_783023 [Earliella scabrosa]|nr:hypothetical protein C8Q76DRAFT_783023 [Earliella scabrosa]